jgi:hypothetical protein
MLHLFGDPPSGALLSFEDEFSVNFSAPMSHELRSHCNSEPSRSRRLRQSSNFPSRAVRASRRIVQFAIVRNACIRLPGQEVDARGHDIDRLATFLEHGGNGTAKNLAVLGQALVLAASVHAQASRQRWAHSLHQTLSFGAATQV